MPVSEIIRQLTLHREEIECVSLHLQELESGKSDRLEMNRRGHRPMNLEECREVARLYVQNAGPIASRIGRLD